jgi:hypothetical protein
LVIILADSAAVVVDVDSLTTGCGAVDVSATDCLVARVLRVLLDMLFTKIEKLQSEFSRKRERGKRKGADFANQSRNYFCTTEQSKARLPRSNSLIGDCDAL